MNKLGTPNLMKIASVGGVFVIGNALLMRFLSQKKLKQSPYFVQARDILMDNRALLDFLGEPIGFGSVDLDNNSKNFSTGLEAKFEIPLKGSKHEGTLYLWSVRKEEDIYFGTQNNGLVDEEQYKLSKLSQSSGNNGYSGWNIKNLEITVKDKPNQKLILVQDSVLTKTKGINS